MDSYEGDPRTLMLKAPRASTWLWYLMKGRLTHLQVVHPVLTFGVLLLGRLTLVCLVVSLSELSPDETFFLKCLRGILWLSLGSITDAFIILCTENGGLVEDIVREHK